MDAKARGATQAYILGLLTSTFTEKDCPFEVKKVEVSPKTEIVVEGRKTHVRFKITVTEDE